MTLTRSLLTAQIPGLIGIASWLLMLVLNASATLGFGAHIARAVAVLPSGGGHG